MLCVTLWVAPFGFAEASNPLLLLKKDRTLPNLQIRDNPSRGNYRAKENADALKSVSIRLSEANVKKVIEAIRPIISKRC